MKCTVFIQSSLLLALLLAACEGTNTYRSPLCEMEGKQNKFACVVKVSQSWLTDPDEVRPLFLSNDHSPPDIESMMHSMLLGDRAEGYITAIGGFDKDARRILLSAVSYMQDSAKSLEGCRIQLYLPKADKSDGIVDRLERLGADVTVKSIKTNMGAEAQW
ncbi:MAG: hypothetical protein U5L08_16235 [Xanthomonadales bacterium]|nr:hypothetical protein [Xanthomonadales bacterium]